MAQNVVKRNEEDLLKKGASFAVTGIGLLLIAVIILIFAQKAVGNVFADKRAETEVAAMGIRNSLIYVSLAESGRVIYSMPGNEEYGVEIDGQKVSVQYEKIAAPQYRPKISMMHYTSGVVPNKIIAPQICIVNKKDVLSECKNVLEICKPDESCCTSAFQETSC